MLNLTLITALAFLAGVSYIVYWSDKQAKINQQKWEELIKSLEQKREEEEKKSDIVGIATVGTSQVQEGKTDGRSERV